MYLKSLDINGFKSFAIKTKLAFEPGITAIVGPNGCGKSNVSDAIKWVLGEQSAKAMRGTKMEDCIFNGTDTRKPLGMAEVSICFADCEKTLGMDFNEVSVTRRVFRSGEGQYFINKAPCRLKDIQRLFMDTGIGTTSYSFMEQGRIDQILSSRPEDRREVFEEAAGITKYKSDKKEAIRKLDQTEANLLRLADVIREVKRQIGSLQRQAGKARRYQVLREELRKIEMFATRRRMTITDGDISEIEQQLSALNSRLAALHREVEAGERGSGTLRESLVQTEREIGAVSEAGMQAQSNLDHTREMIRLNSQRVDEYRAFSERDVRAIDETRRQIAEKQTVLQSLDAQLAQAQHDLTAAEAESARVQALFAEHQRQIDSARLQMQRRREESIETESVVSRLQNEMVDLEAHERSTLIRRERLAAEKAQLSKVATSFDQRRNEMTGALASMKRDADEAEGRVRALETQKAEFSRTLQEQQQTLSDLLSQAAARQAQIDILSESEAAREGFPSGGRLLLDPANPLSIEPSGVLGALASHLTVEPEYRTALEAALRAWLDAVLLANPDHAFEALRALQARQGGAGRLLSADAPFAPFLAPESAGIRLLDRVRCPDDVRPLLAHLIGNVVVADSIDCVPRPVDARLAYVTREGALVRGDGSMEFWMHDPHASPLSRRHARAEAETALHGLNQDVLAARSEIARLNHTLTETDASIEQARRMQDASRRTMAQKEGELQVTAKEAENAAERLSTVTWELDSLIGEGESGDTRKQTIRRDIDAHRARQEQLTTEIGAQTRELQNLEARHTELQSVVTEHRIRCANMGHKVEQSQSQHNSVTSHVQELTAALDGRSAGVQSYAAAIDKLSAEIESASQRLVSLEELVRTNRDKVDSLKRNREKQAEELKRMEDLLAHKREELESARDARSDLQVRLSESRMRRQNLVDRITAEYNITQEQLLTEPDPAWEGDPPSLDAAETQVAELRAKIEAMGPVNLIAIEEYKELEERHAFLTQQEEDLVNAKQQLMDMIRKINRTTTEMFRSTFEQVNANFQDMFKRLFNGGTAKLVMVDEEDVLESGIEIIARPPGKRLQNVSLLSGGERTLTAVSLLFAIYLIKPSPFCMLDELDAALDESNIGRFVAVLQESCAQSQFVVITHNRQTISAADILYGVTMPEKGISKLVSMRFRDANSAPEMKAPEPVPPPESFDASEAETATDSATAPVEETEA